MRRSLPAEYAWLELRGSIWYPRAYSPVLAEPLGGGRSRSGWRNGRGLPETGLPVFGLPGRFGPPEMVMRFGREAPILTA